MISWNDAFENINVLSSTIISLAMWETEEYLKSWRLDVLYVFVENVVSNGFKARETVIGTWKIIYLGNLINKYSVNDQDFTAYLYKKIFHSISVKKEEITLICTRKKFIYRCKIINNKYL